MDLELFIWCWCEKCIKICLAFFFFFGFFPSIVWLYIQMSIWQPWIQHQYCH
jgi:hypothetical protein